MIGEGRSGLGMTSRNPRLDDSVRPPETRGELPVFSQTGPLAAPEEAKTKLPRDVYPDDSVRLSWPPDQGSVGGPDKCVS